MEIIVRHSNRSSLLIILQSYDFQSQIVLLIVCISQYYFIPMYLHYKIIEFDWPAHFVTYLEEV